MAKFHVKKGDKVKVLAGEYKGQTGNIMEMLPEKNRALVEGINMIKKHEKPSAASPQGGIIEKEAPIHLSNLMLVDPKTGEATRTGRKAGENGKLERYSKKSQEIIK
jgi:large subunit ribosomal protein L24